MAYPLQDFTIGHATVYKTILKNISRLPFLTEFCWESLF